MRFSWTSMTRHVKKCLTTPTESRNSPRELQISMDGIRHCRRGSPYFIASANGILPKERIWGGSASAENSASSIVYCAARRHHTPGAPHRSRKSTGMCATLSRLTRILNCSVTERGPSLERLITRSIVRRLTMVGALWWTATVLSCRARHCAFSMGTLQYSHICSAVSRELTHTLRLHPTFTRIFLEKRYFTEKEFTTLTLLRRQWRGAFQKIPCFPTICLKVFMRERAWQAASIFLKDFRQTTASTWSVSPAGSAATGRSCRGFFGSAATSSRRSLATVFSTICAAASCRLPHHLPCCFPCFLRRICRS